MESLTLDAAPVSADVERPSMAVCDGSRREIGLSVIVPTYNERENVTKIVDSLAVALTDISWEVIFVDDFSPDGTAEAIRLLARRDLRVRLISRHNRRGLSSAVIEGCLAASAEVIAVMDGDLQHDESVLPELYRRVAYGEAEIASASRFLLEEGAAGLASERRRNLSDTGIGMANLFFGLNMTDPLTGFFAVRRQAVVDALPGLSEVGFKVLLDIITATPNRPRVVETPFRFRARRYGASKLDNRVLFDFFLFLLEKKIAPIIPLPARFLSFAIVNSVGVLVHLAAFGILTTLFGAGFIGSQIAATAAAMVFNYSANNFVTYHDQRLAGTKFIFGFFVFAALCSVGVWANVGAATIIHDRFQALNSLAPAAAGALVTVVWNYVATNAFIWGRSNAQRVRAVRRVRAGRARRAVVEA